MRFTIPFRFRLPVLWAVAGVFSASLPGLSRGDLILAGPGNPVLVEEGGMIEAGNLAPSGTAFALDLIADGVFIPTHDIPNLNDGIFGNSNSWIGNSAGTYCGIRLGETPVTVASVAFGRDNLGGFGDRTLGLYTLRFTQVANPDEFTPVTGDATTGWQDIGTLDYGAPQPGTLYQQPSLRHRFNFDAVMATGFRIDTGANGTCIDEIELYETPGDVQEPPPVVALAPEAGFAITYDGNDGDFFDPNPPPGGARVPDNLALMGTAFGSGELGNPHFVARANDGFYGNANSWISGGGVQGPFIGVDLGGLREINVVAWGRDNGNNLTDCCGGQLADRSAGVYTLQITTDANPSTTLDWTTVGTVAYTAAAADLVPGGGFTPWFRHAFGITTESGDPVMATGFRLLVPNASIAIDELEIYEAGMVPGLFPVESGGAIAAENLASGAVAFAKDTLGGRQVGSLNDQTFGDASAWIGASADSFAGINLGATPLAVQSIAFGRDNTGQMTDRSTGTYLLQFTGVANPGASTPDGDWMTIATIDYSGVEPPAPHLRHRFNFASVMATGIRLLTPDGAAIDELEVYANPYQAPPPPPVVIVPEADFAITWDGNDGMHFDPNPPPAGSLVPDNVALAANGAVAFASSDLGSELGIPFHVTANLNDGIYGNINSWISASADPGLQAFAGVAFAAPTAVASIAWGRDNGNGAVDDSDPGTDSCDGQCDDRSLGVYVIQFTTVPLPNSGTPDEFWTTVGTVDYRRREDALVGGGFTEFLRHEFQLSQNGAPILATGIRLLVPVIGGTAIDELEVYGASSGPVDTRITAFSRDAATGVVSLTFLSVPGNFYALDATEDFVDWDELTDSIVGEAASPTTDVMDSSTPPSQAERYFRIREL